MGLVIITYIILGMFEVHGAIAAFGKWDRDIGNCWYGSYSRGLGLMGWR